MANVIIKRLNDLARYSSFSTDEGCEEFFLTLRTKAGIGFMAALKALEDDYASAVAHAGLSDATAVFSRFYVSDFANQKEAFDASLLVKRLKSGALSIIEEKPVGGGPFSLFSYHIRNRKHAAAALNGDHSLGDYRNTGLYSGKNYSLLLTANYSNDEAFDAYRQTGAIFRDAAQTVEKSGMRLFENTVRTWIYVRDVDNHYKEMVRARREYLTAQGLTDKTRYFASTGIEGGCQAPERLVSMDSLSIGGLTPGQIVRMEAPTHLSPTIVYGVTFERGLRVRFGDRSHLYISGTASINNKGEVMFPGDAAMQTRRAVENLRALLDGHGATLGDMAYIIAYVRNFHEWSVVGEALREELGDETPVIPLAAQVCRPAWLFELEGVAVIPDKNDFAPFM